MALNNEGMLGLGPDLFFVFCFFYVGIKFSIRALGILLMLVLTNKIPISHDSCTSMKRVFFFLGRCDISLSTSTEALILNGQTVLKPPPLINNEKSTPVRL